MTKTALKVTLAALLSAGCSWQPEPLHVARDVPPHVYSAFFDAAAHWNGAQDRFVLDVHTTPDAEGRYNVTMTDLPEDMLGFTDVDRIQIDVNVDETTAWHTAAHELGHYLGIWAHRGEIMAERFAFTEQCIDRQSAESLGGTGTCE